MSNKLTIPLVIGTLLGLTSSAQAQVKFSIGPKVGLNMASASYRADDRFATHSALTGSTGYQPGLEAGIMTSLGWGHWQVQPAVLYSQKGFHLQGTESHTISTDGTTPAPYEYNC
jgi:hypothetical protein